MHERGSGDAAAGDGDADAWIARVLSIRPLFEYWCRRLVKAMSQRARLKCSVRKSHVVRIEVRLRAWTWGCSYSQIVGRSHRKVHTYYLAM